MTSEVCVMNRHALVLAADSATTVTQWTGEGRETRYFKGANKIFQVSNHHPIGLMIFDGADILGVPWEVIAKQFRNWLLKKSFNTVEGYAEEFCSFLETEPHLLPPETQREAIFSAAKGLAFALVYDLAHANPPNGTAEVDAQILQRRVAVDGKPLHPRLTAEEAQQTVAAMLPEFTAAVQDYLDEPEVPQPSDYASLAELVLWEIAKEPGAHLGTTGLVFCGYGDHEIFPSYVHSVSSGMFGGKHLLATVKREAVTHSVPAELIGFAQTGMIDTFQIGMAGDVFGDAMKSFDDNLVEFGEAVMHAAGGTLDVDAMGKLRSAARGKFMNDWMNETRKKHVYPLRRVLAALPIAEMAELAETLINLQSLKEKVTKPSETVGGAIDVAVITKSEGLIWIKRKHFFDPALNARFMARHIALYT